MDQTERKLRDALERWDSAESALRRAYSIEDLLDVLKKQGLIGHNRWVQLKEMLEDLTKGKSK